VFIRLALLRASIIWWAFRLPCQPRSWSGGEREGKIPSADVSRAANKMQANTCLWGRHRLFRVSHSLLLAAELRSSLITVGPAATSSSALVSWTVRRQHVDETIILALIGAPYSTPPKTSIFIYPTYSTQIISFSSTLTSNQPATPRWVTRTKSNGGKCACSAFYFNAEKNHPTV